MLSINLDRSFWDVSYIASVVHRRAMNSVEKKLSVFHFKFCKEGKAAVVVFLFL